jgi:hypothetical protein
MNETLSLAPPIWNVELNMAARLASSPWANEYLQFTRVYAEGRHLTGGPGSPKGPTYQATPDKSGFGVCHIYPFYFSKFISPGATGSLLFGVIARQRLDRAVPSVSVVPC